MDSELGLTYDATAHSSMELTKIHLSVSQLFFHKMHFSDPCVN